MEKSYGDTSTNKIILAVLVGSIVIVSAILISIILKFSLVSSLVMSWILTTCYALFAFFLVDPIVNITRVRTVEKPVYREVIRVVEKPVYQEIQIPMENRIVEVVEKEVPVEKIVYRELERKSRKLNISQFDFIGSTQTRTYHKRTCKFSKMLKRKFKLHSNSKSFFKKKHYKACKTCLKNSKK